MSKEIEFQTLEIELCEKRIRESTALKESKTAEQKATIDQLAERKLDLDQKKGELNEIVAETKQEEEKLREEAKQIESMVEPRLVAAYRDWETDRKSTRLNSSHRSLSRMPSSA